MPKHIRPAVVGAAMIIVVIGSLAFTRASNNVLDVVVYDDPTMERVINSLREWAKDAKVEVQLTRLPYDALFEEIRRGGGARDLMLIDDPWLPALANAGVLSHVTRKDLQFRMRRFAPEFSEVCYYRKPSRAKAGLPKRPVLQVRRCSESEGKFDGCAELEKEWDLYALPVVGNAQLLVIANDLLPEGENGKTLTWPTLSHALSQHAHSTSHQTVRPPRFVFRTGSSNAALADFLPFLRAWSSHRVVDFGDSRDTVTLDNADAHQALQFGLELARTSPVQHARFNDRDIYEYLAHDEAEAGICWLAYFTRMERQRVHASDAPARHATLRALPMPAPNATSNATTDHPEQNRAGVTGAWLLAVGSKASNPRQAWKFMSHVTTEAVAKQMRDAGNPPTYESLLDQSIDSAGKTTFRDIVRAARPRYAHPCWKEIESVVGLRVQQAYWHTLNPEDALFRAAFDLRSLTDTQADPTSRSAISGCDTSE